MLGKSMKLFQFFNGVDMLDKVLAYEHQQEEIGSLINKFKTERNFNRVHVDVTLQEATKRRRRFSEPTVPPLASWGVHETTQDFKFIVSACT